MYKFPLRTLPLRYLNEKTSDYKSLMQLSIKASNTPRPPKDPPDEGYRPESVDHQDIEVSDFVRPEAYRTFNGTEVLGPGAGKSKDYKNAQYFGYHRFSFVELQNQSMELRDERRLNGGIQMNMGEEEEEECADDSLEAMKKREAECDEALVAQLKDGEKTKLKDWCLAIEKKQEEKLKAQKTDKDDEKLKEWCKEIERQQQDRVKKGHKLEDKMEKIQKTIDKRVNEILTECSGKSKKAGEAGKSKENAEKPAVKCDVAKVKEDDKKAQEKEKADKCDKPKEKEEKCVKKEEKNIDKCGKTDKDNKK